MKTLVQVNEIKAAPCRGKQFYFSPGGEPATKRFLEVKPFRWKGLKHYLMQHCASISCCLIILLMSGLMAQQDIKRQDTEKLIRQQAIMLQIRKAELVQKELELEEMKRFNEAEMLSKKDECEQRALLRLPVTSACRQIIKGIS